MTGFINEAPQDIQGRLGDSFQQAALVALEHAFLAGAADRPLAERVLSRFKRLAESLRISEEAFAMRERDEDAPPSLLNHLRNPAEFGVMREFNAAREALFALNPDLGRSIATLMMQKRKPAVHRFRTPDAMVTL